MHIAKVEDQISDCMGTAFEIGGKLKSFAALLRGQGRETEGFTELYGMGLIMDELSDDLLEVWRTLDKTGIVLAKDKNERKDEDGTP